MNRRHVFSIGIGILAVILVQRGVLGASRLIENCCISENRSDLWVGFAMNLLFTLGMLVPGFIAGLVSRTRGILVGFLTGLLGGIANSLAFGFVAPVDWAAALTSGYMLMSLLGSGITLSIPCAAAGGAAETLISRPRGAQLSS
jgi:hypothetical protein